ncbi:CRISPR-associated endonuclease Cas2 [Roseospira visakhapatnamensis]|uniref:CRISPR-associated endoribonuclease Cas2 n=1 Tax=Roseospira visakhapatnamensis TaxID=390880 RepID=A0A7W6RCS6_9PROT|nr:CRISPR-associated endonuclease Cas2 [Roseospira visakhapatnamensis]MBB4266156.1 CRISPR-associated protein Cas2 [Roseospira visakhapatnamensis]
MPTATDERLYIVAYDIADQKRWRRVWTVMNGYGEWLQLSLFQCRLSRKRLVHLRGALSEAIQDGADHVLILDLGPADTVKPRIESLGKSVAVVERKPVIV